MSPAQVETIMGPPDAPEMDPGEMLMGPPAQPERSFEWPGTEGMPTASPETVFNLVQLKIRAGSTAAPNKLQMQDNWNKALQLLMPMINTIRQIDVSGGDSSPERELVKETAARFDETIDVDRFLPPKPAPVAPVMPTVPMPPAGAIPPGGSQHPAPFGATPQGGLPLHSPMPLQ